MNSSISERTREPDEMLGTLKGPVWVCCPRCARPASIKPPRHFWRPSQEPATLVCTHCGLSKRDAASFIAGRARRGWIDGWNRRCGHCGRPMPHRVWPLVRGHGGGASVRARCAGCNHVTTHPARPAPVDAREGFDPWFDLPLCLAEPVGRELLWVWNRRHVDLLEGYLGATLRERAHNPYHYSMASRLPRWMKLATARPRVLHALALLRARIEREGLS